MISVCIASYKRPRQLQALLQALLDEVVHPVPVEIVVCDNDSARSAEAIVAQAANRTHVAVRYFCEPEQNISLARNRVIAAAQGEWIALIDDDELPSPQWLAQLYDTASASGADGVFGPVFPILPPEAPTWLRDGGFFRPIRRQTGMTLSMTEAVAGNALLKAAILRKVQGPFDPRYGRSGGEDTLLFGTLLQKHGARFVGCAEAIVEEFVGVERCSLGWLLRRAFRGGMIWARVEAELFERATRYFRAIFAAAVVVLLTPLAILVLPLRTPSGIRILLTIAGKFGQMCSILPLRYVEYR